MRFVIFFCLALFTQVAAAAAVDVNTLPDGGIWTVTHVVDGDTVVLSGGQQVRLVGIQTPKLPLGRKEFKAWPLSQEAKAALEHMVLGKAVQVRLAPHDQDRYGRILAHLVRLSDGAWVQGEMLRSAMARVYTFPDNRILGAEMLAIERQARRAKIGIWADPFYGVRNGDLGDEFKGTFQVIEDRIVDAARVKKWLYLNFGANWRTDFTVKIRSKYIRLFKKAGIELLNLKGKRVRVRGWLKNQNGPMIEIDHPERLEILGH